MKSIQNSVTFQSGNSITEMQLRFINEGDVDAQNGLSSLLDLALYALFEDGSVTIQLPKDDL